MLKWIWVFNVYSIWVYYLLTSKDVYSFLFLFLFFCFVINVNVMDLTHIVNINWIVYKIYEYCWCLNDIWIFGKSNNSRKKLIAKSSQRSFDKNTIYLHFTNFRLSSIGFLFCLFNHSNKCNVVVVVIVCSVFLSFLLSTHRSSFCVARIIHSTNIHCN